MKAIVNIKGKIGYAYLNGLTFKVVAVYPETIVLKVDEKTLDFRHEEVLILDVKKELQAAYDDFWGYKNNCFRALENYCKTNNILVPPEYNCPS